MEPIKSNPPQPSRNSENIQAKQDENQREYVNHLGKRVLIRQHTEGPEIKKGRVSFHCKELNLSLPNEWKNKKTDAVIICDGRLVIRVHKEVLPPYFKSIYDASWKEAELKRPIFVCGWSHDLIEDVLQFLYTGEIELTSKNIILISSMARLWEIPSLIERCAQFVKNDADLDTCLTLWRKDIAGLDREIFSFVTSNAESLRFSDVFPKISLRHLFRLLDSPQMNVKSEFELFELMLLWGRKNCPENVQMKNFLLSLQVGGKRLIDTIHYEDIHSLHLFDQVAQQKILSLDQLRSYNRIVNERLSSDFDFYRGDVDRYEKRNCSRKYRPSLCYPTRWRGEETEEQFEFFRAGCHGQRVSARFLNAHELFGSGYEFKFTPTNYKENEESGEMKYRFRVKASDQHLNFYLESKDLLSEDDQDYSLDVTLRIINQFDGRRHAVMNIKDKIESGESQKNLSESWGKMVVGGQLIPLQELYDRSRGWIVDNSLILSAEVVLDKI